MENNNSLINISKNTTHKITLISVLVSVGIILSLVDKYLSSLILPFIPTKIGLANIVVLLGIYLFKFRESLIIAFLKVILVGFIIGGIVGFIISFTGTFLSFFGMIIFKNLLKNKISPVGVSAVGGFLHITGQLAASTIIFSFYDIVIYYGGVLVLISLISSIIIGLIVLKILKDYKLKEVG